MEILQTSDVIKLYEHEFPKPVLDDAIIHFGILGMHWGKKNGPPYPLGSDVSTGKRLKSTAKGAGGSGSGDSKKISRKRRNALKKARKTRAKNLKANREEIKKKQEIEKTKEEIIKSKDLNAMLNNMDKFTNQEINDMLNRLDIEKRLKDVTNRQNELTKSKARKLKDFVFESIKEGAVSGGKSVIKTVTKNGVKYYSKKFLMSLGKGDKEYEDLITKLFKEDKK